MVLKGLKMALLKYFKQVDAKKPTKTDIVLLKPDGPLPSVMPSSSIKSANLAVKKAMLMTLHVTAEGDEINDYMSRGTYQHFTSKEKLKLGKRAAKLGISSTVRYFTAKPGKERTLSPSIRYLLGKENIWAS